MRTHRSGIFPPQYRTLMFESLEMRRVLTRLFDIDGDDDLDVLSDLVWYENYDGYGNFKQHVISDISAPESMAADLDGDGDMDILTREPKWYENDGNNQFPVAHDFPGGSQLTELELFDVGGDDDVDILGFTGKRERAYLYENRDGIFIEAAVKDLREGDVDVGDFDLDGRLDTLVFEEFDLAELEEDPTPRDLPLRSLWIELDVGNGQIERRMLRADIIPASRFPEDGPGTESWDRFLRQLKQNRPYGWFGRGLADIDGDGLLDLVWGTHGPDPNYIPFYWSRNDQGVIAPTASFVADEGHGRSYLRDVDHDGDLDSLWEYGLAMELVLMVNHQGEFIEEGDFRYDWQPPPDVGDIDGDGLFDALIGIQDGLPLWYDVLSDAIHVKGDVPAPRPRTSIVFLNHPLQAPSGSLRQTGDFNGDGDLDFLASNYAGSNDWVWLTDTNHDLMYDDVTPIPDSRSIFSEPMVIVDIDLDGDVDLVTTDTLRAVDGYSLIVFQNTDGLGTFRRDFGVRLIVSQRTREQLLVGDIDGDGDQDIVTVDRQRGDIALQVHMNVNGNYHTQLVDRWSSRDTTPIIMTDFDQDGDLDLVTSGTPAARWYEYDDGRFGADVRLGVVPARARLQPHDTDADGDLDLVVADGTAVRIWRNEDGDYVEDQHVAYERTGDVEVVDIDGDGDLDVAVHSQNTIEWFETRNGSLAGPLVVDQTLRYFSNTEFVDWDLDGDLDVVEKRSSQWTWHETRQIGDVNRDAAFDSADLVQVFQAGKYEDSIGDNATFDEGDWNLDGEFDSSDLVLAFQAGDYGVAVRPLAAETAAAVDWLFVQDDEDVKKSRAFVA